MTTAPSPIRWRAIVATCLILLALPVSAAMPRARIFSGGSLEKAVVISDLAENAALTEAAHPASVTWQQIAERTSFDLAEFSFPGWAAATAGGRPESEVRPTEAASHARFYPATASLPALIVGSVRVQELDADGLAILKKHGVPVLVPQTPVIQVNAVGSWKAVFVGPIGPRPLTYDAITFSIESTPTGLIGTAQAGSWPGDLDVADIKVESDRLSFTATGRKGWGVNGVPHCCPKLVFAGTIKGDEMTLTMTQQSTEVPDDPHAPQVPMEAKRVSKDGRESRLAWPASPKERNLRAAGLNGSRRNRTD